jgi:3-mercaptopyruvate sulfurtransferase SseA
MRWTTPVLTISAILASCADPSTAPAPHAAKPAAAVTPKPPAPPIQRGSVKTITFEEFFALHQADKLLVLDARPSFFHNLGHIPGALSVPRGSSAGSIRELDGQFRMALSAGKSIVTYCTGTTCPDARALATQISALGHPVSIFSAGWHAWKDAELPTE